MDFRNPGVKSELLVNSFLTLFPGCKLDWKNSQGIFNQKDKCMVKRSLCFSLRPISLETSALPREFIARHPRVFRAWALCGANSTRANKATDTSFILCNKVEKHFTAVAVATFSPSPDSKTGFVLSSLDSNVESVNELLEEMKKEKEAYSVEKSEKKKRPRSSVKKEEMAKVEIPAKRLHFAEQDQDHSHASDMVVQPPRGKSTPVQSHEVSQQVVVSSLLSSVSEETVSVDVDDEPTTSIESDFCLLGLLGQGVLPKIEERGFSGFFSNTAPCHVSGNGFSCSPIKRDAQVLPSLISDDVVSDVPDSEPVMFDDWYTNEAIH